MMKKSLIMLVLVWIAGTMALCGCKSKQDSGIREVEPTDDQLFHYQKKKTSKTKQKKEESNHPTTPEGQYSLGVMYHDGIGVKQDLKEAVKWIRKAANQGHVKAQFAMGYMCMVGDGVAKDAKQAREWYYKAGAQGDADAQYNLGVMYELGDGGDKNLKEAELWYQQAASKGHADAMTRLNHLKSGTTPPANTPSAPGNSQS